MRLRVYNTSNIPVGKAARPHYEWTSTKLTILLENYERLNNHQLATALGMGITNVRTKLYELGYKRLEMEYWTEEQVAFLVANYRKIGDVEMSEIFEHRWPKNKKWTEKHIRKKRVYLNLHRSPEEVTQIKVRNTKAGRFKDCSKKMWQKRGIPPVGTIRVWQMKKENYKFKVIKTETGYVHYAPWLWQQLHGPIPEGYIIAFKDNDSLNVIPENLEIITRAEHARRVRQYPPELAAIIKLFNDFKNTVNKLSDDKQTQKN